MKKLLISLCLLVTTICAYAQANEKMVTLYLNNGTCIVGELLSNSNGIITLQTEDGDTLKYTTSEVRKVDNHPPKTPDTVQNPSIEGVYTNHLYYNHGFYFAAESNTAINIRPNEPCFGFEEIDVVGGYRWGYFLRAGIGLGGRYYWRNNKGRSKKLEWAMPLFLDLRGEFMPRAYRIVTPYWNMQLGGAFADGFMLRPTIGIRIGEARSAFLIGLSYTGQSLTHWAYNSNMQPYKKRYFESFISLKLGYEF